MVKESERKKAYHPRAPHKEGCLCGPCKAKRGVGEEISPPPDEPVLTTITEVRLDSLPSKAKFMLNGQAHMVKEHVEGMVVSYNFAESDTSTLSGSTMVSR